MNGINCHKISDPQQACNDGDTDCTCSDVRVRVLRDEVTKL